MTFQPAPNGGKTSILVRVGVSFISSAQACANAEEEIPDFDFTGVQNAARAQWNDILGRVQVDTSGVDQETVELFYSSVSFIIKLPCVDLFPFTIRSCTGLIYHQPIVSSSLFLTSTQI